MIPNFRRRLLWLLGGRVAVVTLLLGSATLIQINAPGSLPIDPFFFLIGLTYALTLVYVLLLKQAERHPWIVDVQLACDAIIVSALVYMTNGVASYFTSLYALPIIAASTLQSRRSGMLVGTLSSVLYAGLVGAQSFGTPALSVVVGLDLPPRRVGFFIAGLNIFGVMAVAALSGYLAERLRRTGAALEQASDQIAGLQAFSEHVISSLTAGLVTTDIDGQILTFNNAAAVITGIPAIQAIDRRAAEVLTLPGEFIEMFGTREARPKLPRVEYRFKSPDGREIVLGISTAILRTPRGEVGFVFTFQDVTEARRQEREARIQHRLAAVGEMAAGIAHEIRNPLASMSGSLQILRQELPLSDEQSQLMDIVLRESDRLNETIRSFLAYAKPQRSALSRIDVRQVVTDAGTLLQNSAQLTEAHSINCDVPHDPVWCLADEARISADCLEPGDQRSALHGRRRQADPLRGPRRRRSGEAADGHARRDRRRHRHRARRARRNPAAVPRRIRARDRAGPVDCAPHRERLRRRAVDSLHARQGNHGDRQAAGGHGAGVRRQETGDRTQELGAAPAARARREVAARERVGVGPREH